MNTLEWLAVLGRMRVKFKFCFGLRLGLGLRLCSGFKLGFRDRTYPYWRTERVDTCIGVTKGER